MAQVSFFLLQKMSPSSYTYGGVQVSCPSGLKPNCLDNCAAEDVKNKNSDDNFEESSLCASQNSTLQWVLGEVRLAGQNLTEAEVLADSDYLSLSRYLNFLVFT